MKFIKLTEEQIINIYNNNIILDFPKEEIKPLKTILRLTEEGFYNSYGLFENHELVGYAFLTGVSNEYILLDYLAICSEYRGKGCGSEIIKLLKNKMKEDLTKAIIIEIEKINCAKNDNQRVKREKRKHFYVKNKVKISGIESKIFGTEYEILYLADDTVLDSHLYAEYNKIYKLLVDKKQFDDNVLITEFRKL